MACISSETKPAPILGIRPSANFQVVISPTGTPRHWLQPMLKCALAKNCGMLRPYPRRPLSPQAPDCPARKPVTRGGMPAPVGGGSRRPALSDKDGVLLRVIGVGWIVRRRPGGLIPKELYSSLPVCCRHLPHPAASKKYTPALTSSANPTPAKTKLSAILPRHTRKPSDDRSRDPSGHK